MSITEALINSVLGIGIVFLTLILLMFFIKLLNRFTGEKSRNAASRKKNPAPQVSSGEKAPGSAGELKLYDTNPRDAAMCMAIVADMLKKPLEELRFISIREIK